MSLITSTFEILKEKNKTAFIPFLMAGDPDYELSLEIIKTVDRAGTDLLEIGLPYSAPLADGPTIQQSARRALESGFKPRDVFQLVEDFRKESSTPVIIMSYLNLIHKFGGKNFIDRCQQSGVNGIIVPDLPPEEGQELKNLSSQIDLIWLLSSNSPADRIEKVTRSAEGFIYAVSTPGTTGSREKISLEIKNTISKIKEIRDIPVCVGFGISRPEQVKSLAKFADGVIVGSAIIEVIEKSENYFSGSPDIENSSLKKSTIGPENNNDRSKISNSRSANCKGNQNLANREKLLIRLEKFIKNLTEPL